MAALLTRHITDVMRAAPLLGDDRESLVRQIVSVANLLRRDEVVMSVLYSELAPIYITERLGSSQQMLIDALADRLRVAQRHGSVRAGDDTTRSPTAISPADGSTKPAIRRNVVVLPQPDGPSRQISRPWSMHSETSSTTATAS